MLTLIVCIRLSLEEKSWWKMQVLYNGGVIECGLSRELSREGSSIQPIELNSELSREGSSIQLIGQTCRLVNFILLELVNFVLLQFVNIVCYWNCELLRLYNSEL